MISARVRNAVRIAKPNERVTLIVSLPEHPDPKAMSRFARLSARRDYIDRFYVQLKKPVLDTVKGLRGIRLLDDLGGTNMMVLEAQAATWRRVLAHPPKVFVRPNVRLTPSETVRLHPE
jgi:hypothetical protein